MAWCQKDSLNSVMVKQNTIGFDTNKNCYSVIFWRKARFVKHVMEQYVIAKMTLSFFLKAAYNMYRCGQGWTPTCKFIQEYALTLATSVPRSRSTFPTFQRVHIRIGCQYPILRKCCQLVHKVATAFPVPATGRPKICLTV